MGADVAIRPPANVTLGSHGATLVANGYRIVPIEPGTKSPNVPGWSKIKADKSTVDRWVAQGRGEWGIGILGETTPGVDLDISDEAVLEKVMDWCRKNIGVDNTRVGRAPRVLFTCHADAPFPKMSSTKFEAPDGSTHQIEILGKGNQYVAYAVHPDTHKPYLWTGLDPLVMPAELLPPLTPEVAKSLIEHFESIVPDTWKPISKSSVKTSEHEGNPLKVAKLHRLKSAMDAIPNADLPYGEWIRVMYALWAAVGEQKYEGFEIFDNWSSKSSKYDFEETLRVWEATREVSHIGAGTLFHLAKENGWAEPVEDTSVGLEIVEGSIDNTRETTPLKPPRFILETLDDLARLPKPKWLVDGWFPEDSTGILFGKWGSGKSFLAFDLGLHIAYGLPNWHGADVSNTGRKVLVLAREGHQGFVDRAEAFRRRHGIKTTTPNFVFLRAPVNFMHAADFNALEKFVLEYEEKFALVIVDTVARVMAGADMSSPESVTAFMERCDRLSKAAGGTVIGVHHENKGGTLMGSTFFEANSDFVYNLTRDNAENAPLTAGTIKCTKMKDGPDGWSRAVKFAPREWESEGEVRGSLAIEGISWSDRRGVASVSLAASTLLDSLQAAVDKAGGHSVSWSDWKGTRYREVNPSWKIGDPLPEGCADSTLTKRRTELINAGFAHDHGAGHFAPFEKELEGV